MSKRFALAQISDTHVRADDGGAAVAQLRKALAQAAEYSVDAILMTGDLVNDEGADEYAAFAQAVADPPAPLFVMPGNHDDRARMRAALSAHRYLPARGDLSFVIDDFAVRIVAIDQIVPGQTYGSFPEERARWLDEALAKSTRPTLVALHHPPFLTHDLLFDRIGLRDNAAFEAVIARHPQVRRIICGHHHRVVVGQVAHAPVVVAPSTSWIYGLATHDGQPIAPKTAEQPGWMLHLWTPAGFASHFIGL